MCELTLARLFHLLRQDLIDKRLIGQSLLFGRPAQPTQDLRIEPDGDQLSWLISQGRPPYAAHTEVAANERVFCWLSPPALEVELS